MLNHYDLPPQPQPPKVTLLDILICLLATVIVVSIYMSCSPKIKNATQAANGVMRANEKFPDTVAALTRKLYPCIETGKEVDSSEYLSVRSKLDAVIKLYNKEKGKIPIRIKEYIKDTAGCVEECNKKIEGWQQLSDLQEVTITDLKNQIIDLQNHPVTVIKKIKDSAESQNLNSQIAKLTNEGIKKDAEIASLKRDNKELKQERNDWRKYCYIGVLALIIYIVARVYKKSNPKGIVGFLLKFIP